eukprot:Gregarina_sp_Poly_1__76@NODE_1017_length_5352_cov_48_087228_g709_i0_p1_GENE_NODE_1017_length_5352_cov_48_087228_g709_i0NODE_1017_length_5352_cov_48_087228_g709_i0_p1_ORF_typecomplete_len417_score56_87TFIIA_gamma_N/PF02268_16/0_036TFIIA_gamma_N/PF02268_16/7_1e03_NODE_1017_length_5352_cov_48_087228_g709_i039825232
MKSEPHNNYATPKKEEDVTVVLQALRRIYQIAGEGVDTKELNEGSQFPNLVRPGVLDKDLAIIIDPAGSVFPNDVASDSSPQSDLFPRIKVSRGFEQFPFGITAYRHTTLGECLINAISEVRTNLSRQTSRQITTQEEDILKTVLSVFDEIMVKRLRLFLRSKATVPFRKVLMKGQAVSFKNIDGNQLYYCQNIKLLEHPTKSSQGFRLKSSTLKLALVDPVQQGYPLLTLTPSNLRTQKSARKRERISQYRGMTQSEMMDLVWMNSTEGQMLTAVNQEFVEESADNEMAPEVRRCFKIPRINSPRESNLIESASSVTAENHHSRMSSLSEPPPVSRTQWSKSCPIPIRDVISSDRSDSSCTKPISPPETPQPPMRVLQRDLGQTEHERIGSVREEETEDWVIRFSDANFKLDDDD